MFERPGLIGNLINREKTGKGKPLDVCYVGVTCIWILMGEDWIKDLFLGRQKNNSILDKLVVHDSEVQAEECVAEEIKKFIEDRLTLASDISHKITGPNYNTSKNKQDLNENAYWILTVKGRAEDVNQYLQTEDARDHFFEKVISARNNTGSRQLFRVQVQEEQEENKKGLK